MVVGGGDSACDEALFLARLTDRVTLVHRGERLRAQRSLAARVLAEPHITVQFATRVTEIRGAPNAMGFEQVAAVTLMSLRDGAERVEPTDAVFVCIGSDPRSALVPDLPKDAEGRLLTDDTMQTPIPGLFAVGDVRSTPFRQLIVAAGEGATQEAFIEHAGIPTLAAVRIAADALREIGEHHEVGLIVSGGIRSGADVAKAMALGATAVSIGVASMIGIGCNRPSWYDADRDEWVDASGDYAELGTEAGYCHHCHTGRCPVGITTQDPELSARLDPEVGAAWMTNYLRGLTMELTTLARACGKSDVHNLEREDLLALTIEAAAMAGVPLAGTTWIPGR